MLRPSMSQIIGDDKSQYAFVVAVAKNARKISDEAEKARKELKEADSTKKIAEITEKYKTLLDKKPVTISTEQFAARKVAIEDFIEDDDIEETLETQEAEEIEANEEEVVSEIEEPTEE